MLLLVTSYSFIGAAIFYNLEVQNEITVGQTFLARTFLDGPQEL